MVGKRKHKEYSNLTLHERFLKGLQYVYPLFHIKISLAIKYFFNLYGSNTPLAIKARKQIDSLLGESKDAYHQWGNGIKKELERKYPQAHPLGEKFWLDLIAIV